MKNSLAGISISILLHLCLLGAVLGVSVSPVAVRKPISLDFTLINEGFSARRPAAGDGNGSVPRTGPGRTRASAVPPGAPVKTGMEGSMENSLLPVARGIVSEPEGPVAVVGKAELSGTDARADGGSPGGPAETGAGEMGLGAGKGGSPAGIDFGTGGSGLSGFTFIRHDILKNIRYPEKARRMRWEGRVLLTFSIFEDGSVKNIVVARSSGFPVLDESARQAVTRTTFTRRIPQRLDVVLPVEYRLQ